MFKDFNYFTMIKDLYKMSFDNFTMIFNQQKKLIESFMEAQPDIYKDNMKKLFDEWSKNVENSFNDYKGLVIKGLEYLEETYNKMTKNFNNKS